MINLNDFYSINEAAQLLEVTPTRIKQMIKESKLNSIKKDKYLLVSKDQIDDFKSFKQKRNNFLTARGDLKSVCNICFIPCDFFNPVNKKEWFCKNHTQEKDIAYFHNDKFYVNFNCGHVYLMDEEEEYFECSKCIMLEESSDS